MIYLVTFAYPNPTHNRTETFSDESEAYAFFCDCSRDLDNPVEVKRAIFLTYLDGYTAQVIKHIGSRDLAHAA